MDSMLLPALLFSVLLLALLAAVIFLQLQQSRQNRETMTFLSKLQESGLEATRSFSAQTLQQVSSQISASQGDMLSYLQDQTAQTMRLLSSTVTATTRPLTETTTRLTEALTSAQAMLATQEPMAYQAVRGASIPFTSEPGTGPYTSTEELAMADAVAKKIESDRNADEGLRLIQQMAGVQNVEPYPVAGSGLLGPAPTAG